ncbi:MAG: C2 family cysteine protease [Thermoguttaceae bacterium]
MRHHSSRHDSDASLLRRRSLRMEHLESRMLLSASVMPQAANAAKSAAAASAATVLTLSPSADAYVNSAKPTTNYGTAGDLLVQSSSGRGGSEADAYLKFDLSSISSSVTKAVLNLTPLAVAAGTSSVTIGVQLLKDGSDSWVEGVGGSSRSTTAGITWMSSPNGYGQIVTLSASQLSASTPISIDVTQLINQKFNANGMSSFVIGVISSTPYGPSFGPSRNAFWSVDFASRDNANTAVRPTLSITTATTDPPPTVVQQPTIESQTSTSAVLSVLGDDATDGQSSLAYTWSVASSTAAIAPTFSVNGTNDAQKTTVTFHQAGTYVFTVKITDKTDGLSVTTNTVTVTVTQTLSGILVSPSSATVALGATQQLTASGVDQFGLKMALAAGSVTWTAAQGTFSGDATGSTVTYVAPSTATTDTVTAASGSFSASVTMTVVKANFLGLTDAQLAALTQSLDVDGSINRADMIKILDYVESETDGIVSAADLSDLKTILKNSATLNIVSYVGVLANDVINGSVANAHYLGQTLGNLTAGSSNAVLEKLINKWFYGTDLPTTGGYSYDTATAGTLYGANGASHTDEKQGDLGDCYLISSLGSIADSSQAAIKNMLIDNGDGTYTVRFYSNGVADYVTVNTQLPVSSKGTLVFDGYGTSASSASNVLWLELIEKAYAQWNETGKTGRDSATNSYAAIEGGWMGDVYAQTLNCADTAYSLRTASAKQTLISALSAGKAATIGTVTSPASGTGLYGNHAYNVLSYDSATGLFTLYNPWGSNQPAKLTWSQLVANCDGFAIGDASAAAVSGVRKAVVAPHVVAPIQTPSETAAAVQPSVAATAETPALARTRTFAADAVFASYDASDSLTAMRPFSAGDAAAAPDATSEQVASLDELLAVGLM